MIKFRNQLSFTLPLAILIIVVVLIAVGGTGYYFYKTSQEEKEKEAVPEEEAAAPKGEYAEVTLTLDQGEKMDFQAKTIFVSEIIWGGVPYIQIALFGESPYIADYVLMGQLEKFLSTVSLEGIINNIKKKEEETGEAKGIALILVKKPEVIPQKVVCDLVEEIYLQRDDPLCHISIGPRIGGEPLSISFGKPTFYFKENDIIEGEYNAYYGGNSISGKFRIKIRKGVTLIEKEKLIEEAERKIKEAKGIQEKEKEISDRDRRRDSDIRQIELVMHMYYGDQNQYPQSKTMPTAIGEYLKTVPRDPKTGEPYHWLDNTFGSLTGCDAQHFCCWAELEGSGFKFKVVSEKGVTQLKTQPTKCPCL